MIEIKTLSIALLPLAMMVGCGSTDPGVDAGTDGGGGAGACQRASGRLLPWKVGNKWTYKVTQGGVNSEKITTIEGIEPVGGAGPNAAKMANKVVTKKGLMDQTISWQAVDGDKVVRYREQSFGATSGLLEMEEHWDPYKLHIDGTAEHMVDQKVWVETYKETKIPIGLQAVTATAMDAWKVVAECEVVEIGSESYKALKLTKTGGDQKTYWYAPGIGKVKETGNQIEELLKYEEGP
jgi:hypothetical protein